MSTAGSQTVGGYTLFVSSGKSYLTAPTNCVVHTGNSDIQLTANVQTQIGSSSMTFYVTDK